MTFDDFLPKALFISLTLHTVFLCSTLLWHMPHAQEQKSKGVEISYQQQPRKAPDVRQHPIKPSQKFDLKNTSLMA